MANYRLKHTGEEIDALLDKAGTALQSVPSEYITNDELNAKGYLTEHQDISGKQDVISDLEEIREGAALGATALQSVPSDYVTEAELEAKGYLTTIPDDVATKTDVASAIAEAITTTLNTEV